MRTRSVSALAAAALLLGVSTSSAGAAGAKRCAPGLFAGSKTSCAIARGLLQKVGRSTDKVADGRRVKVRSSVTGKTYSFFLYRADSRSFTCRAYGNGILTVRITN